jgi:hypothetical protein
MITGKLVLTDQTLITFHQLVEQNTPLLLLHTLAHSGRMECNFSVVEQFCHTQSVRSACYTLTQFLSSKTAINLGVHKKCCPNKSLDRATQGSIRSSLADPPSKSMSRWILSLASSMQENTQWCQHKSWYHLTFLIWTVTNLSTCLMKWYLRKKLKKMLTGKADCQNKAYFQTWEKWHSPFLGIFEGFSFLLVTIRPWLQSDLVNNYCHPITMHSKIDFGFFAFRVNQFFNLIPI